MTANCQLGPSTNVHKDCIQNGYLRMFMETLQLIENPYTQKKYGMWLGFSPPIQNISRTPWLFI